MVVRADGTPVYVYIPGNHTTDYQLLLSGFLAALQIFAKRVISGRESSINSLSLSDELYTFRALAIKDTLGGESEFNFVLISEPSKASQEDIKYLLECLIVGFLSHNRGEYTEILRSTSEWNLSTFSDFDNFMDEVILKGWNSFKKSFKPQPSSLIQGILNDVKEHLPVSQILSLHQDIVVIGNSYVWLSVFLSQEEEEVLLKKVEEQLHRLYGPGMYQSLVKEVRLRLEQ